MVDQRDQVVTDRAAREAWQSAAALLGMSNRAAPDVLVALRERLEERNRMHQELADLAERDGADRSSPISQLLALAEQAFTDRHTLVQAIAEIRTAMDLPVDGDQEQLLGKLRTLRTGWYGEIRQALGVHPNATHDDVLTVIADRNRELRDAQEQGAGVAFAGRLRQALGMRQETTHHQIMDEIVELRLKTKTAHLLADRLEQPRDTPVADLLEIVAGQRAESERTRAAYERDGALSSEEVGLLRELAEEVRAALELPTTARNQAVLNRIGNLQATRAQHETAESDLREQVAGMHAALQARLGLPLAADWPDILAAVEKAAGPRVETMTQEEWDRQNAARQDALRTVMDLWAQYRLGDEPDAESLVAMAAYVATGDLSLIHDANSQRIARTYDLRRAELGLSGGAVDGARWTPGDQHG